MKSNFFSILKKVDGELVHTIKAKGTLYKNWIKELPEGAKVEIFVSVSGEDGTNAQLAKVHAMIREVANEVGHTFQEMKLEVKRKTGLCFVKDGQEYCKSFKDCSKQELNLVIQSLIEMGDFVGVNLR
tara:strand:+ start:1063 stop:1446 length:384 start_codon:yes stop_codon:yes gene_type:complete